MEITRRFFMKGLFSIFFSILFVGKGFGEARKKGAAIVKINKSKDEWKTLLSQEAFHVLREEGTERPFTSSLLKNKEIGIYVCAGCELPLFTSEMKYDSGTGWPSFTTSIEGHLETKRDFKLIFPRTEYHCARCEGHQGHVFDDGPAPTFQRWCNNGVALKFIPNKLL